MARPPLPELSHKLSQSVCAMEAALWELKVSVQNATREVRRLAEELRYANEKRQELEQELATLKTKE